MKKEDHGWFACSDGKKIQLYRWLPDNPRAVLLIIHGMMEHAARYSEFADFIVEKGIAVYAPDHRGHGRNVSDQGSVGHFDKRNGWERIQMDLSEVRDHIAEEHPGLPVFLMGHSMGSLLARDHFAETLSADRLKYKGLILSGVTDPYLFEAWVGNILTSLMQLVHSNKYRSRLLSRLSYGKYNASFRPNRTPFDWLSSDKDQVDRYIEDPLCGQPPTLGFWKDFFKGIVTVRRKEKELHLAPGYPLLFVFGGNDPVGRMGRDPKIVAQKYCRAGSSGLTVKIYEGDRHEILNEKDRYSVYQDIVEWFDSILTQ